MITLTENDARPGLTLFWATRRPEQKGRLPGRPGPHVLDAHHSAGGALVVTVETDEVPIDCRAGGDVAIEHGWRIRRAHDAPAFGPPVVTAWRARVWWCPTCAARNAF